VSRLHGAYYILGNLKIQVEYEKPLCKLIIKNMLMFSIIINAVDDRLYKSEIKNSEFLVLAFCDSE